MSRDNSPGAGRILSFLFAFTVLFALVFGLGVFVGKRLGRQELKISNTFEEAPPEPTPSPAGETEPLEGEGITESPAPALEQAAVETPAPSATPGEAETNSTETEKEVKATEPPKSVDTAAPVKPDDKLAEVTREIQRDLEKKRAAQDEDEKSVKQTIPQVDPTGAYTVQIGSFQDQKQANNLAGYLQSKGYPVFIKSMTSPDNEKWYRVRVGTFKDIESAKAYGEFLK
ncbi:MAG TPA: SPOR domain-containing protein, partial [Thermodesulfobacteriota bacterium]|nr:SPOR domain-containing protein [Thermodesulfobacteriota bacterium]